MKVTSHPASSLLSSPNVAALLNIKILSWSQETGFPVCVRVRIADTTFNLHKLPLTCKSGYFREKLKESNDVELPHDFPGGAETFQMIALFIYGIGSSTLLEDPFNVAALKCAAEFLHMTGEENLCERFDIYLNHVVLQSWNHTLIVLQKCLDLLPWAEDLLIVSRCIETLAFMACMEILDPERRRRRRDHDPPVVTLEALSSSSVSTWEDMIARLDLWMADLIALPLPFFNRVIASLRRQGMKEKYVCPIILFYAHKWVISRNTSSVVVQGVIDLLPSAAKAIPIGFYLSLLSTSIKLCVRNECVEKLQDEIASALHLAQLQDFLRPRDGIQPSTMETIFSKYMSSECRNDYSVVSQLWDAYLNQIAYDSELSCKRFMDLIETVPISSRQTHDHLYRALNTFFQSHPNLSQEEKGMVCKYLNCQKLSQEACVEAVQNELMPLRLIVQVLFVQQLHTQQAFRKCSNSFRYATNCVDSSGSLSISSSRCKNFGESPFVNASEGNSRSLGFLLQEDSSIPWKDYESTSFRIQNLEKEVMSLKRCLILQPNSEKIEVVQSATRLPHGLVERRIMSKKQNPRVTSCIGTVNFASQRKYANRILKILQRVSLFGRGKSKRKPAKME